MSDQSEKTEKTDQTEPLDDDLLASGERPFSIPAELPVLPLRDTVLFPNSFMPLAVAREASVRLIDEATTSGRIIGVFTQREASVEEPVQEDLYPIGTATHIHKMFKLPDGSLRLIVQGLARVRLDKIVQTRPYLRAAVKAADESVREEDRLEIDALQRNIKSNFQQVVSLSPLLSDDLQALAANITDPGKLADFIASSLATIGTSVRQEVLDTLDIRARMDSLNRGPRARLEDPVPGAVRGRQEPARILPPRTAQGDSERARRGRRAGQRD
jgi:ATP-dependent Lon protease